MSDVALIMCQQAVEKALKALYIAQTGKFPPRIHSIERLADLTEMRSELEPALLELEDFYTTLRYPDFTGPLPYELVDAGDSEQAISLTANALHAIEQEVLSIRATHDDDMAIEVGPDDDDNQT